MVDVLKVGKKLRIGGLLIHEVGERVKLVARLRHAPRIEWQVDSRRSGSCCGCRVHVQLVLMMMQDCVLIGRRRRVGQAIIAGAIAATTAAAARTAAATAATARRVHISQTGQRKVRIDAQRRLLGLLLASPLGSPILEPDLNSHLGQVNLYGQLFPTVHVGIVRLLERALQLVQLKRGKRGPIASVLVLLVA